VNAKLLPASDDANDRTDHSMSLFQKILLATDGTVTDLIALYTGEPIRVKRLGQSIRTEIAPDILACPQPIELLSRKILLSGSKRNYLYAESLFVFNLLSESIQRQLLTTDRPIGLMWKEERLESYREILEHKIELCADIAGHFELPASTLFASRTYLIHQLGRPLGAITEKWPLSIFRDPPVSG